MTDDHRQSLANLVDCLRNGEITRRHFMRSASLLGLSFAAAEALAACSSLAPSPTATSRFQAFIPDTDNIVPTPAGGVLVPPTAGRPTSTASEPERAASSTPSPTQRLLWFCAACGQKFKTLQDLKQHAADDHAWRLPDIRRVAEPTYSEYLGVEVERFDERNTVFSRTIWDEEYKRQVAGAATKAPPDDEQALEGRALVAGAIYVDATAGALHPNYYGYMGHVNDTEGLYGWDDPVAAEQFPVTDRQWMSERVKAVARLYGADLVGICELDQRWVYSHYFQRATGAYGELEIPYRYAVVMGIEMDWQGINASPGFEASAATALAYSQMAELASSLARYIRGLGYPAIPCGNDTAQSIPLAIDAGLGELGRNGLLISPEYGPRQRICKVLTDLPLQPDEPIDFGAASVCETCHICVRVCPANAIRGGERTTDTTSISNRRGILRWPVDVASCYLFWQENGHDCSNCVAACPWAVHNQRRWLES
jgi:epoxyqueuosine reductase